MSPPLLLLLLLTQMPTANLISESSALRWSTALANIAVDTWPTQTAQQRRPPPRLAAPTPPTLIHSLPNDHSYLLVAEVPFVPR